MSIDDKFPRTLLDVCRKEPFYIMIHDNVYCRVGYTRRILCNHQSEERDKNDIYVCLNPLYQVLKLRKALEEKYEQRNKRIT